MQIIVDTISPSPTQRDRRAWAMCKDLPFVDCGSISPNYEPDCGCLNNEPFYYPVKEDDTFDIQTFLIDEVNTPTNIVAGWHDSSEGNYPYELEIVNCSGQVLTGQIDQYASEWLVGYTGEKFIQSARIDFSLFWEQLEEYFCVRIAIQDIGSQTAIGYVYFPPMKKDICSSKKTLEIQSTVSTYDCIGRFYGLSTAFYGKRNFQFDNWRRLYATLEADLFAITSEETDTGIVYRKTIDKSARFRTWGLPYVVANELAAIWGGSDIDMAGEIWETMPDIEKNNDNSQMWYVDGSVTRRECEFGKECD